MLLLWPSFCTSLSIWHSFYSRVGVLPLHGGCGTTVEPGGTPLVLSTLQLSVSSGLQLLGTPRLRGDPQPCACGPAASLSLFSLQSAAPRAHPLTLLTLHRALEKQSGVSPWDLFTLISILAIRFFHLFFFSSITSIRTYWPNGEERPEVKHQCSSPTFPQVSNDPLLKGSSFWILLLWEAVTLSIKILYYIFSFPLFFPIRLDIFTSRRSCAASSRTGLGTFPPRLASWTGRFAVLSPRQASLWDEKPHHTEGEKAPVACWYLLWEPQFSPREFHLHEEIFA